MVVFRVGAERQKWLIPSTLVRENSAELSKQISTDYNQIDLPQMTSATFAQFQHFIYKGYLHDYGDEQPTTELMTLASLSFFAHQLSFTKLQMQIMRLLAIIEARNLTALSADLVLFVWNNSTSEYTVRRHFLGWAARLICMRSDPSFTKILTKEILEEVLLAIPRTSAAVESYTDSSRLLPGSNNGTNDLRAARKGKRSRESSTESTHSLNNNTKLIQGAHTPKDQSLKQKLFTKEVEFCKMVLDDMIRAMTPTTLSFHRMQSREYCQIIPAENRIDLRVIENKLKTNKYTCLSEFEKDMQLQVDNLRQVYPPLDKDYRCATLFPLFYDCAMKNKDVYIS